MLEGLTPINRKKSCAFAMFRDTLEASDQRILDDAMENPEWSTNGLVRALNERGLKIAYQNLYRHRSKGCSCDQTKGRDAGES